MSCVYRYIKWEREDAIGFGLAVLGVIGLMWVLVSLGA